MKTKENLKQNKAITLVALVITIIILVILAGVSVSVLSGENGLIARTKSASEASERAAIEEQITLAQAEAKVKEYEKTASTEIKVAAGNFLTLEGQQGGTALTDIGYTLKTNDTLNKIAAKTGQIVNVSDQGTYLVLNVGKNYVYTVTEDNYTFVGSQEEVNKAATELVEADIREGVITASLSSTAWTKEDITVTLSVTDNNYSSYRMQYSYDLSSWSNYNGPITVSENKTIYARLSNGLTNTDTYSTTEVTNIDKLEPSSVTFESGTITATSIQVTASATDADAADGSGKSEIKEYSFSNDNGETWTDWQTETTYNFTGLTSGTDYTIKVEAKDNAGNTKVSEASTISTVGSYTVVFNKNANDATGTMNNQTFTYGVAQNLTTNGFTRSGYTFLGWSTSSTATTATYANGQSVSDLDTTNSGSITLYAIWQRDSKLYLYNSGNEYSTTTGGWNTITRYTDDTPYGFGSTSKESTYLYLYSPSYAQKPGFKTTNKIDFSNYTTLKAIISYNINITKNVGGCSSFKISADNTEGVGIATRFGFYGIYGFPGPTTTGNFSNNNYEISATIDKSNITVPAYVMMTIDAGSNYSGNQTFKIHSIWLEN